MNDMMKQIEEIARHAGAIMLDADRQKKHITSKEGHANFVTEYDAKVQHYLFGALTEVLPEAHFLGEEEGHEKFLATYSEGYTFVIDPIDGTSNFMKQVRPSVTSIGLLKDGSPYAGVVYEPHTDQLFSALRGAGAFENGLRMRTSGSPLAESLVEMGTSPYNPEFTERTFDLAAKYLPLCIDIRRSGSAAWDLCMVASGRIGLYFECITNLYDIAAGACIAMEAGAAVTDLDGNPIPFTGPTSIAAASEGVAAGKYLPGQLF